MEKELPVRHVIDDKLAVGVGGRLGTGLAAEPDGIFERLVIRLRRDRRRVDSTGRDRRCEVHGYHWNQVDGGADDGMAGIDGRAADRLLACRADVTARQTAAATACRTALAGRRRGANHDDREQRGQQDRANAER